MLNGQWTLARRPPGGLPVADDFAWNETSIPTPGRNQMLTRTIYLSLDPYQWGRRRGGVEAIGDVCHGRTVAQVIDSRLDGYRAGDFVFNTNGWQQYGLTGDGISVFGYMFPRKLDAQLAPISTAVGVLGMLGLTAYAGLVVQCAPRAGETVAVSAASGGVGQVVGQIAKILGCRVVGIAGTREKCNFVVDELGFDACVSHRDDALSDRLAAACPGGIDIYFENVGGVVFDAVLPLLNARARVPLCGLVAHYNDSALPPGPDRRGTLMGHLLAKRIRMQGFIIYDDYGPRHGEFFTQMSAWLAEGKIRFREQVIDGLENAPQAFIGMLEGRNFGKLIIRVPNDQHDHLTAADAGT